MIGVVVLFIVIAGICWRIFQTSYNPLAHFLNSGANNDETMQESELTKLLDTANSLYQSRNWISAEKAYLRILKFDHANLLAFRRLGLIYTYMHNYTDAAECLELVIKSDPTAADYQNYATILHHAKKLPDAIRAMQRSLTLEPSLNRALSLAKLYAEVGDKQKQYEAARAAAEISPSDPAVVELLGRLRSET